MTVYTEGAYREARLEPPPRRLRYDPTRPIDDGALRAARRHTTRVRWLKIALPILAIAGAGAFWSAMHFVPTDFAAIARGAGIDVTADSVVMNKPHISGFEGTRRAYEVHADNAVQNLSDPKVVTFNGIDASVGLEDAGTAKLTAAIGVYDGNQNTLLLKNGIVIATDTGYSASVDQAALDLGKGSMVSTVPIEISGAQGSIRANAVSVSDRGKHVIFSGGVSVSFLPKGDLAGSSQGK
jgi:lipopolysaccharide export system protein LptC